MKYHSLNYQPIRCFQKPVLCIIQGVMVGALKENQHLIAHLIFAQTETKQLPIYFLKRSRLWITIMTQGPNEQDTHPLLWQHPNPTELPPARERRIWWQASPHSWWANLVYGAQVKPWTKRQGHITRIYIHNKINVLYVIDFTLFFISIWFYWIFNKDCWLAAPPPLPPPWKGGGVRQPASLWKERSKTGSLPLKEQGSHKVLFDIYLIRTPRIAVGDRRIAMHGFYRAKTHLET